MNTIEAILTTSEEVTGEYLNFKVDGYWLDEKLDELYANSWYKGLIPTLVSWLQMKSEKDAVWKRILPAENETSVCPILMCPEDYDFSCTLIVAEIHNSGNTIKWTRLGIDQSDRWPEEKVGTTVEWFDKVEALSFSKADYLLMLETFKHRFDIDQAEQPEYAMYKPNWPLLH